MPAAEQIIIDGVVYPSKTAAAAALGIPRATFIKRLFAGWSPDRAARTSITGHGGIAALPRLASAWLTGRKV